MKNQTPEYRLPSLLQMRRLWVALIIQLSLFLSLFAYAAIEVHEFSDPQQEARYKNLVAELRCLVCQNQNLAESDADLAKDLRQQTYDMIISGDSDQQVIDYMVERYGDFVLYRPPLSAKTYLLWSGPFIFMAVGLIAAILFIRRRQDESERVFDENERKKARQLLNEQLEESES